MSGNAEFKLIVMCYLCCILSCISILKSCELKLYDSVDDRADFCTVCHILDMILINKISNSLKFFVNSACRTIVLIYEM